MLLGGGGNCQGCGCSPENACTEFYDGSNAAGNTGEWIAAAFKTPAGGLTLSSATLEIDTANTTATISEVDLRLFSSTAGNLPNAALLTLTPPASIASSMTWTAPDEPLTGNTRYYLVLRTVGNGAGSIYWNFEGYSNGDDNTPCELYYWSYTSNGGGGWGPPGPHDSYYLFDIN